MATDDRAELSRRRFVIGLLLIYLAHVGLVLLGCPPDVVFGDTPFGGNDYQTHYQQASTVGQALERSGRAWAYDPGMLAGFPAGLIFDVDNKAHGLWTLGLQRLGLSRPVAFNLFTLVSCLICPLVLLLAARLLGVKRGAQLVTLALASLLWNVDSAPRFGWAAGMVSFVTTSHLCVLTLVLYYRALERWRPRLYLPLLLLLPLCLLVHVWAFAILALPMVGLYLIRWRRLGPAGHARVWLLAAAGLAGNLYWLWPALNHLELMEPSGRLGQTNPLYFFSDYLGLLVDPLNTGFTLTHSFFRYLALFAAGLTLWGWRRERDGRLLLGALSLGWLLGLTYLAALVPGLREMEPFRFVAPSMFVAVVLAGPWLTRALAPAALRALPTGARALLLVTALLALPRGLREVFYYNPELWPSGVAGRPLIPEAAMPANRDPGRKGPALRLAPVPPDYQNLSRHLQRSCREPGRLLVQRWPLAEYLRWATDLPIIGGFPDRRTIHEDANLFRHDDDPRRRGQALANYLVLYNVRYLLMSGRYSPRIESRADLLEPHKILGQHRIYRVRHLATYFASGGGRLRAEINRLQVSDARPAPGTQQLVLRFHHLRTLRCSPGCVVQRQPVPGNRAGFIRVVGRPRLPQQFVVENGY